MVGAGDKVNVYVPSILSTAIGPVVGSQFQIGPVILTSEPPVFPQTSAVITKSPEGGAEQGLHCPYTNPLKKVDQSLTIVCLHS